ncbi:MAG TPA: hypothetical protein PKK58_01630 [Opitutaceae bacterium]|nr:hypothetical protein [Opitutaceae bacterium]
MRHFISLLSIFLCTSFAALAQDESAGEEALIELSPFSVASGSDAGYQSSSVLAGSRIVTPIADPNQHAPLVPITLVKKAEAVVVQFVLSNNADKQDVRNRELYATIENLQKTVIKTAGLRLEQREVRFASGNRKLSLISRSDRPASFASIVVFADLTSDAKLLDRVKQVRDLLDGVELVGQTKLLDGVVGLYLRQPSQYRRELLEKIFADLELVRKGLGAGCEVIPNGLAQRVQMRACSENEIELWIDYSFQIRSVRELEAKK